jgi:hypothetical protein
VIAGAVLLVIAHALFEVTLMNAPPPGTLSEFRLLLALAISQPVSRGICSREGGSAPRVVLLFPPERRLAVDAARFQRAMIDAQIQPSLAKCLIRYLGPARANQQ